MKYTLLLIIVALGMGLWKVFKVFWKKKKVTAIQIPKPETPKPPMAPPSPPETPPPPQTPPSPPTPPM